MTKVDEVRQAIMHALDANRSRIDTQEALSRIDITIFINARSQSPQDYEMRVTTKGETKRQRVLDDEESTRQAQSRRDHDLPENPGAIRRVVSTTFPGA